MLLYLEFHEGTSAKFWQIEVVGSTHTVSYGKIGTTGQSKTKTFAGDDECQKDANKLIKAKKAKGYAKKGEVAVCVRSKNTGKQAVLEALQELVKTGDYQQVLPFIEKYKNGNMAILKKELPKIRHYWLDYQEISENKSDRWGSRWGRRGNDKQSCVIGLLGLALLSPSEINGRWDCIYSLLDGTFFTKNTDNLDILKALKPTCIEAILILWLNNNEIVPSYDNLRFYEKEGLINYNPTLFSKAIAEINDRLFSGNRKNQEFHINTDYYLTDCVIIERDIPLLFEYETDIHTVNQWKLYRFLWNDEKTKEFGDPYYHIFAFLIKQGKLDRLWVLQKCLEIQSSLWSDPSKSYFRKLFEFLLPSESEKITLQDNLLSLLTHENKVVVNFSLNIIKDIYQHTSFDMPSYLAYWEMILMNIENKTAIKTVISHAQYVLKNDNQKQYTNDILSALCSVFMVNDISINERVAKIIAKYTDDDCRDVLERLSMYQEMIHKDNIDILNTNTAIKNISKTIEQSQETHIIDIDKEYCYKIKDIEYFALENEFKLHHDFHELLFSISGISNNQDVGEYERILASYLKLSFDKKFPEDSESQLKSILGNIAMIIFMTTLIFITYF